MESSKNGEVFDLISVASSLAALLDKFRGSYRDRCQMSVSYLLRL